MILSSQLKEHLKGPKAFYLGTRDKDFTTDIVRGLGSMATGPDSVKFFIAEETARKALDNIRSNRIVTFSVTNVFTLESYQLKGRLIGVNPVNEDEKEFIHDYIHRFDEALSKVGLPAGLIVNYAAHDPALAVEFAVDQIFDQTPKIGTGKLVSAV